MSSLTFKAVIGAVHFDPKKGIVKIQLEATSYVSLDALTSLGPRDESVRITLESEQTRIDAPQLAPTEGVPAAPDAVGLDEEGAEWLKKAADGLEESGGVVDEIGEPLDGEEAEAGDMEE
jgi:hypothetical protein